MELDEALTALRSATAGVARALGGVELSSLSREQLLSVVEVKVAPEPTAIVPAASTVARGTRILRRLGVVFTGFSWWMSGGSS